MKRVLCVVHGIVLILVLVSCAGQEPTKQTDVRPAEPVIIPKEEIQLPKEEQQQEAFQVFNDLLALSQTGDRSANREKKLEMYFQIINQYPDASLAQESFWRVIDIYLKEYSPPKKDEALHLFQVFKERYPQSPMERTIENSIVRAFYQRRLWEDIIIFERPKMEEFVETGKLESPGHMLMFAEAKMNLKDYEEASKGYKIIIKYFPKSAEADLAKKRLKAIKELMQDETLEMK